MKPNIVLIGYRGCGKTTVGRLLADRLGRSFVDTDPLIEARAGKTIAEVFATESEAGFRDRESEAIAIVTADKGQILSVGGGAILDQENVDRLQAKGLIVWLTAPAEVLWRRISADAHSNRTRPNLTAEGGLKEVQRVLAAREASYKAAAEIIIDTADRTPEQVVTAIADTLCSRGL